jgi:hypothetical protein
MASKRLEMDDQQRSEAPPETVQAWGSARRIREPVAWMLLAVTAIAVLVSAWQLFGLPGNGLPAGPVAGVAHVAGPVAVTPGAPVATPSGPVAVTPGTRVTTGPSPVAVTPFGWRASAVAPQFVAGGLFTLPVLSVVLVAFAGGLTDRARQVVQTAISIQAVTLGLGVLSWLGALGALGAHLRPGVWFIFDATDLAAVAVALIFTVAVRRSQALRRPTPQFQGFPEDEGVGEDGEDFEEES